MPTTPVSSFSGCACGRLSPPGIPDFFSRQRLERGRVTLTGRAWSGNGPVEASRSPSTASGRDDAVPVATRLWRGWSFEWEATPGEHELACRATDAAGDGLLPLPGTSGHGQQRRPARQRHSQLSRAGVSRGGRRRTSRVASTSSPGRPRTNEDHRDIEARGDPGRSSGSSRRPRCRGRRLRRSPRRRGSRRARLEDVDLEAQDENLLRR